MKKVFHIALLAVVSVWLATSCSLFEEKKEQEDPNGTEMQTDTIQSDTIKKKSTPDSLYSQLLVQSDSLKTELADSKGQIDELRGKIEAFDKYSSLWHILTVVALVIGVLSVLAILFSHKVLIDKDNAKEICRDQIKNSPDLQKIKETIGNILSTRANPNETGNLTEFRSLEKQIADLRSQLEQIQTRVIRSTMSDPINQYSQGATHKGYARINEDKYFVEVLPSNAEGCVFVLTYLSDNKAKFTILSLNHLKSRDGWEKVVECTGCHINDAQHFEVIGNGGECEKVAGENVWEVTKKLKIKISK